METLILNENEADKAAKIIKIGGIVGIPTETVYGLAADAFNPNAIKKIFLAKGRPADNPLIVHISKIEDVFKVVSNFTEKAKILANFVCIIPRRWGWINKIKINRNRISNCTSRSDIRVPRIK